MTRGGYQILDLGGTALSTSAVTIDGIYDKIEGTSKAKLLTGITIGSTEYADAFVAFALDGTDYEATLYGYTIKVTDDDEVTATAIE